jgi:hypothetical protein
VVFSAGNAGSGASTLTKQSKNAILVGNSLNARPGEGAGDDVRGLATGSSRGPAADGRLLPTVIAPGTDIVSCRATIDAQPATPGTQRPRAAYTDTGGTAHANHVTMGGTSMASPHVAGCACSSSGGATAPVAARLHRPCSRPWWSTARWTAPGAPTAPAAPPASQQPAGQGTPTCATSCCRA